MDQTKHFAFFTYLENSEQITIEFQAQGTSDHILPIRTKSSRAKLLCSRIYTTNTVQISSLPAVSNYCE